MKLSPDPTTRIWLLELRDSKIVKHQKCSFLSLCSYRQLSLDGLTLSDKQQREWRKKTQFIQILEVVFFTFPFFLNSRFFYIPRFFSFHPFSVDFSFFFLILDVYLIDKFYPRTSWARALPLKTERGNRIQADWYLIKQFVFGWNVRQFSTRTS